MSRTVSLAFVLVLLAAAGAAQVPEVSKAMAPDPILMAALEAEIFGGITSDALCFAIADCYPYSSVSCWASSEAESCEAVDRNCAVGHRGHVRCGGSYTYCPECCTDDSTRDYQTGDCCENGRREWGRDRCINGEWVFETYVCGGPCGPPNP